MNIIKNITIEFGEDDVKQIVAEYLLSKGYDVEPSDISFRVGSNLVGIGPMEHEVTCFKGCIARVKGK